MGLLDGVLEGVVNSALRGAQGQGGGAGNPLGDLLGSLVSGNSNQAQRAGQGLNAGALLAAGFSILQQSGGLSGLVETLKRSGLGAQADSWVGTGDNQGISPDQLQKALGESALTKVAAQLGLSPQQAGSSLSQLLPELVNQLTPQGRVPDNHAELITQGLSALLGRR